MRGQAFSAKSAILVPMTTTIFVDTNMVCEGSLERLLS